MRSILLALLLLSCSLIASAQLAAKIYPPTNGNSTFGFYEFKPPNWTSNGAYKHPLIIGLHGLGQHGTIDEVGGIARVLESGLGYLVGNHATMQFSLYGTPGSFVVLLPQKVDQYDWPAFYVEDMINYAIANLNIDPNKIFITGHSLGGGGTWVYPSSSVANAQKIAGILPVASSVGASAPCNIASGNVAVWGFHSSNDSVTYVSNTQGSINAINGCNPPPNVPARLWNEPLSHFIYEYGKTPFFVYDTLHKDIYPNVFEWMLGVKRGQTAAANQPPISNVGNPNFNDIVQSSKYQTTLDATGSTDPTDVIISYSWDLVSKPAGATIYPQKTSKFLWYNPQAFPAAWPILPLVFDKIGSYVFKLTVTDLFGVTSTLNKTITIGTGGNNIAPFVDLGADKEVANTVNDVMLFTNVFDWEGLATTQFSVVSQPAGANVVFDFTNADQTRVSPLTVAGDYIIRFTAIDAGGLITTDDIKITKQAVVLPLNLLKFESKSLGNKVLLSWKTANEINVSHFEVMKSLDGVNFLTIGKVTALDAIVGGEYDFADLNAIEPKIFYQLKTVDKDGKYKLSKIISITNGNSQLLKINIYPVPAKNNLSVLVEGNIYGNFGLKVFDLSGKLLKNDVLDKAQGKTVKDINISSLMPGTYFLELKRGNDFVKSHLFVKQ